MLDLHQSSGARPHLAQKLLWNVPQQRAVVRAKRKRGEVMLSSRKFVTMTRVGFAARGIMYLLIGYLSLRVGRSEDGAGAMEYLDSGAGKLLLALMAVGFFAYAAWRLLEAWLDSEGHGSDGKGTAARLGGAASGIVHLALAFTAAKLASGSGGSGGGAEGGAAAALSFPAGRLCWS
jgi:hypothetical protein